MSKTVLYNNTLYQVPDQASEDQIRAALIEGPGGGALTAITGAERGASTVNNAVTTFLDNIKKWAVGNVKDNLSHVNKVLEGSLNGDQNSINELTNMFVGGGIEDAGAKAVKELAPDALKGLLKKVEATKKVYDEPPVSIPKPEGVEANIADPTKIADDLQYLMNRNLGKRFEDFQVLREAHPEGYMPDDVWVKNAIEDLDVQARAEALADPRIGLSQHKLGAKASDWFENGVVKTKDGDMKILWRGSKSGPKGDKVYSMAGGAPQELGIHIGSFNTAKYFAGMAYKDIEEGVGDRIKMELSDANWNVRAVLPQEAGYLYPIVTNIKAPLRLEDMSGRWTPEMVANQLVTKFPEDRDAVKQILNDRDDEYMASHEASLAPEGTEFTQEEAVEASHRNWEGRRAAESKAFKRLQGVIKNHGYDSVYYVNTVEGPGDVSFIVFDNAHIKSVAAKEFSKSSTNWLNSLVLPTAVGGTALEIPTNDSSKD